MTPVDWWGVCRSEWKAAMEETRGRGGHLIRGPLRDAGRKRAVAQRKEHRVSTSTVASSILARLNCLCIHQADICRTRDSGAVHWCEDRESVGRVSHPAARRERNPWRIGNASARTHKHGDARRQPGQTGKLASGGISRRGGLKPRWSNPYGCESHLAESG